MAISSPKLTWLEIPLKSIHFKKTVARILFFQNCGTVKLGIKELFDKEQIGIKE